MMVLFAFAMAPLFLGGFCYQQTEVFSFGLKLSISVLINEKLIAVSSQLS